MHTTPGSRALIFGVVGVIAVATAAGQAWAAGSPETGRKAPDRASRAVPSASRVIVSRPSRCGPGGCKPERMFEVFGRGTPTGSDELKKSIEASGQSVRPAGSMAAEMAREKWEAAQRDAAAQSVQAHKSEIERARELIAAGKFEMALVPLKSHVAQQLARHNAALVADATKETAAPAGDAPAERSYVDPAELADLRRLLGFVLLAAGHADAASAVVRDVYRQDPDISTRALNLEPFGVTQRHLSETFAASVTFANRAKTGSSWLVAAMLAQSQGRWALSRTLVDRGVAAGLDRDIADAFAVAVDARVNPASGSKRSGTPKATKPSASVPGSGSQPAKK
jgi:hypothetical protein